MNGGKKISVVFEKIYLRNVGKFIDKDNIETKTQTTCDSGRISNIAMNMIKRLF